MHGFLGFIAQNLGLLEHNSFMTTRLSSGYKPIYAALRSRLLFMALLIHMCTHFNSNAMPAHKGRSHELFRS